MPNHYFDFAANEGLIAALEERRHLYQFGLTGEWTHGRTAPFTAGVETVVFDVAGQIQYARDYGAPNHGFWLLAPRSHSFRFFLSCGIHESANRHRSPPLWIINREAPHAQPWNGHAFAWSFGTDDQYVDLLAYPEVVETYAPEARMTRWLTGSIWMDPAQDWAEPRLEIPANRIPPRTMRDLLEDGYEIAQHTRTHGVRARTGARPGRPAVAAGAGLSGPREFVTGCAGAPARLRVAAIDDEHD